MSAASSAPAVTEADSVESTQSDFSAGLRWMKAWQAAFFSLYTIVFAVSLALYVGLLRAAAVVKRYVLGTA